MSQYKKRSDVSVRARTGAARSPAERLEPGRAPKRPRGIHDHREPSRIFGKAVRVVSGVLTITLVAMLMLGGVAFAIIHQFESPGPLQATRTVVVPSGGRIAIAELLEREGIITNRWTFVGGYLIQAFLGDHKSNELKAGEYEIKDHASMHEVLETLTKGKSIPYKITLPEGLTSQQIVERIRAEPTLSGEVATIPPEGTLLPDTYYFSKGSSRQDIVNRMQDQMKKSLAGMWEKKAADLPIKSLEELVTFASIVEKETGRADERDRVAAVFYNRLKKGMRLQSDPTIIYGLVGGQGSLGRPITKNDIEERTTYNTYQINGLPPGPICNPGLSALQAALTPADTADLYFVADGSGGHAFSETLKEHNSAVQKWRETEKQQAKARHAAEAQSDADPDVTPIPSSAPAAAPKKTKTAKATASDADAPASDDAAGGEAAASDDGAADIPLPTRKPKRQ